MLTGDVVAKKLTRFLADRPEPIAVAYLFGSVARGTATSRSDVDLAILLSVEPAATLEGLLLDLEAELETEFRLPVQIVILNGAPVDLVHRVLRDGIIVCERDAVKRIAFEMRARAEYFDLKPILDAYRHAATSGVRS